MRPNLKLVGLGLACFIVFLIALLPARAVFALLPADTINAFGVSGSIWNGSAKIINASGQQLRNTEWDIALSQMLLGRLGGEFKTRWNGGFIEGYGSISLGGTIRLSDTQGSVDASALPVAAGSTRLSGQISLRIDELVLTDNWPRHLVGHAEVTNLTSPLMGRGSAGLIGNFAVDFDSNEEPGTDAITGKITDIGGPLELKGSLLLSAPANYTLKTRLKARADAPDTLRNNLDFLGAADADGSRVFDLAGSL
jgi:general secretion pathway protein N